MNLLYAVLNPIVRTLLRSPLHGLMSGNTMLLSYRGRRSGRQFVIPVSYVRTDRGVGAFAARESAWWKNLQDGPEVELRLAGRSVQARARVEKDDRGAIAEGLTRFLVAVPRDAGPSGVRLASDGTPDPDDVRAAADRLVAVFFEPSTAPPLPGAR